MQPIRRVISCVENLDDDFPDSKNERFTIIRECGHEKHTNRDGYLFSICHDCPPLSDNWTNFVNGRNEWICKCGVGHYDARLNDYTVHGCCGKNCCSRDDFPGKEFNEK